MEDLKQVLLASTTESREKITKKYLAKVPKPLNSQFENKPPREEAIRKTASRKRKVAELFPESTVSYLLAMYVQCIN